MDTNNIPADFAFGFSQSNPNASNDDMVAAWQQKNPTPDPTPDPINEGVDPAANAGDPPADGSADPQANPAPAYDFSKFGLQNEDELTGILGDYKRLKEESKVMDYVKNPFANDTIKQINNFSKSTGINDLNLATTVINTSDDDLKANPVKAIAIEMLLSNPKLASVGLDEIMEGVAQKYNVDMDYIGRDGYKLPPLLKMDATSAIESLEKKRSEFMGGDDYFVNLQTQAAKNESARQEHMTKWEQSIPEVKAPLKALTHSVDTGIDELGQIQFSVAVSEQEVDEAVKSLKSLGVLEGLNPDKEGIASVRQAVEFNLRLAKMDDIIRESVKAVAGKLQEKIVKDNLNIGPVTPQRITPAPQSGKVISPAEQALDTFRGGGR
jgi:hypothetical protein